MSFTNFARGINTNQTVFNQWKRVVFEYKYASILSVKNYYSLRNERKEFVNLSSKCYFLRRNQFLNNCAGKVQHGNTRVETLFQKRNIFWTRRQQEETGKKKHKYQDKVEEPEKNYDAETENERQTVLKPDEFLSFTMFAILFIVLSIIYWHRKEVSKRDAEILMQVSQRTPSVENGKK